jgi:hypothetical protein
VIWEYSLLSCRKPMFNPGMVLQQFRDKRFRNISYYQIANEQLSCVGQVSCVDHFYGDKFNSLEFQVQISNSWMKHQKINFWGEKFNSWSSRFKSPILG